MKKVKKIFLSLLLSLCFITGSFYYERNTVTAQDIDSFLIKSGMPDEVLECLSETQKQFITTNLNSKNLTANFNTYKATDFVIDEEGFHPFSEISDRDLTITVVAYETTVDGTRGYIVFPSFIWHKDVKIKNDSFAFVLYPNWEIAGSYGYNLCVWIKNIYGDKVQSTDVAPDLLAYNAQSYKMTDTGFMQGLYEGNGIFYVRKMSSTASPEMVITYIHDTSSNMSISYNIEFKGVNITTSSSSEKLDQKTGYFTFAQ